ncbi:MAG: hypothetical protein ACJ8BW_14260 [Ktedonobacteraceae bacterium]
MLPCPGRGGTDGLVFATDGDGIGTAFSVSALPLGPAEAADIVFDRLSPDVFFAGRAGTGGFGRSGMLGTLRNSVGELPLSPLDVVVVEISGTSGGAALAFFSGLGGTLGWICAEDAPSPSRLLLGLGGTLGLEDEVSA